MEVFNFHQLVTAASVIVLLLFFGKGQCDSICPDGVTNITASSGELVYPQSGTYGKNETKCWRIEVPDTYDYIVHRFPWFDVERCSDCKCDYLQIASSYSHLLQSKKSCGRHSYNFLYRYAWKAPQYTEVSGSTIYLRFVSDGTVHYTGFKFTFIAESVRGG
ncbi:bone morphogenetic protein 1-like [Stylophora pistillata]|uniref:bone morphogenetic protein 1-like n=1 Tax=Stylophora pistillata TaxID=50429 RepID=UPI000C0462D7|nr:bone morphogenetic protein 1-like [Stylophora pistillata]